MEKNKIDRRVQKTKKYLTEALIDLILEKGYEKVTIQNIIDKANVGRSTFYSHYENKEQLLLDGHNNLKIELFKIDVAPEVLSFENLFIHLSKNKLLTKVMLGSRSGNVMPLFFKNNISHKIKNRYKNQLVKNTIKDIDFLSDALGAAILSMIVSWIEDNMQFSAKEMNAKCQKLVIAFFEK